jgi:hypothetical protein
MKQLWTPRIQTAGPRPLWTPRPIALRPASLSVRYETAICDRHGRLERVLQRGRNTITNWGMDQLASQNIYTLINYLVLSSTQTARKRALQGGNNLTVTYTSPTNISVVADAGFFASGDVGYALALPSVPELKITAFTDSTHVTCQTPSGEWLPGFTAPGSPTAYATGTVYYTSINTLDTYFTQFNTYEAGGVTLTTDASNSRFIHQRVFLSATVSGSAWVVNQLGWSDGNGSHDCFGIANLGGADNIPIGKKYRVTLTVYSGYTPIDLAGVAVDWGATIGAYTMDIRQELLGLDQGGYYPNVLQPSCVPNSPGVGYATNTHALVSPYWEGQSGGTTPATLNGPFLTGGSGVAGSYTNGQFKNTKTFKWPDGMSITNATVMTVSDSNYYPLLTLKPQSGTVTKPLGYWCDVTIKVFWTRDLPA